MKARDRLAGASALALMAAAAAGAAAAQQAGGSSGQVSEIVVTAQRLDAARQTIDPALGATEYSVSNATIEALPGGDNQQLNQVILQLPGVVQDSFGQIHVRDDHNNIQYRINGMILPEGISVFGQTLSPRLIEKLDLLTGAMPAQYGLRTAGVIDITTKSGLFNDGGQIGVYGGSHGTYEPSFEYGGSAGATNFFISGDYRRTQLGIENPDSGRSADHDRADAGNLFAYVDHILDDNNRISLVAGYSNDRFQIPDTPGLQPDLGLTVNGRATLPSSQLDDTQRETTAYGIASYLHDAGKLTLQSSLFVRYSTLDYRPDKALGDLLYNGISQAALKKDFALGLQTEGAYRLNDAHTIRAGIIVQGERGTSQTTAQVLPTDDEGNPTSDVPQSIVDNGAKTAFTYSAYVQDEWKVLDNLTINYGLRGDVLNSYRSESQLSPRINIVWLPAPDTTLHAGYARYFTPPPFELVATESVAKFNNTTAAAPTDQDTTPYSERENYYDLGVQQRLFGHALTLGLDAWYRQSHNLIDEGQFGAPIVLTPFNYREGVIKGVELSLNYAKGPLSAYANFTAQKAQGKDIVSSQFSFDPDDLAYIRTHFIYLDHDQTYTASAGVAWRFEDGALAGTRLSGDLLFGSGLRKDGAVPNGDALPDYVQVNVSVGHTFHLPYLQTVDARLDVVNAFDEVYEIRDGTGVGVGAPQYGPRRGVFVGVVKSF